MYKIIPISDLKFKLVRIPNAEVNVTEDSNGNQVSQNVHNAPIYLKEKRQHSDIYLRGNNDKLMTLAKENVAAPISKLSVCGFHSPIEAHSYTNYQCNQPLVEITGNLNSYKLENYLAEGSFGVVRLGRNRFTKETVAIKYSKCEQMTDVLREADTLKKLSHPNIVALKEVVFDENDKICLVMEYGQENLHDILSTSSTLPKSRINFLTKQLLQGVQHLHLNSFMHRDLKPTNLLVTSDGILKICDMGLVRNYREANGSFTTYVGTLWYRAPEILLGSTNYGPPSDLWAVGCIYAEMVSRAQLFPGKNELDQIKLIFSTLGTPTLETCPKLMAMSNMKNLNLQLYRGKKNILRDYISDKERHFLLKFLTYDEDKRITAAEALNHEVLLNSRRDSYHF